MKNDQAHPNRLLMLFTLAAVLLHPAAWLFADGGAGHRAQQGWPIQLGTSGGNINDRTSIYCCSGTLGGLVEDANGVQYILSNNHVMGRSNQADPGEPVNHPGMIDQGCNINGIVAEISQVVTLQYRKGRSTPINYVDAAMARVVPGAVRSDGSILDIGGLSSATLPAFPGQAVQKSGRTTGHTFGTVNAIDVSVNVGYSKECGGAANQVARFENQISIGSGTFSAGGDSGSVIVEAGASGLPRAVGLLFAGSDTATIANPIDAVLSALNVTMVSGSPPPPPTTGQIEGTVTDASTGSIIQGATVTTDTGESATTDGSGFYQLSNVPVGDRSVTATASGHAAESQTVSVAEDATSTADFSLEVQVGPTQTIVECLTYNTSGGKNADKNLLITVLVVNDLGAPVANASVTVAVTQNGSPYGGASGTTSTSGEVTFNGRNAPNAVYETTVTSVTQGGLAFEGSTPVNAFNKGTDPTPLSFCLGNPSGQASPQEALKTGLAFNKARQIKARNSDALFNLPSVAGHGISFENGRPVIQIYLTEESPAARRQIPGALEGTPVHFMVTGPFIAY